MLAKKQEYPAGYVPVSAYAGSSNTLQDLTVRDACGSHRAKRRQPPPVPGRRTVLQHAALHPRVRAIPQLDAPPAARCARRPAREREPRYGHGGAGAHGEVAPFAQAVDACLAGTCGAYEPQTARKRNSTLWTTAQVHARREEDAGIPGEGCSCQHRGRPAMRCREAGLGSGFSTLLHHRYFGSVGRGKLSR